MSLHENNQPEVRVTSEKLSLSSGRLLIIDQFLLSQKPFVEAFAGAPNLQTATDFGASLIDLEAANYFVSRSPLDQMMCVSSSEVSDEDVDRLKSMSAESLTDSPVIIDTRCVVFIDAALIDSGEVMTEYRKVRETRGEKAARDFLRERGAAVRYGFNRLGDKLKIGQAALSGRKYLLLTPDENPLPS